jgi:hypothetical protein
MEKPVGTKKLQFAWKTSVAWKNLSWHRKTLISMEKPQYGFGHMNFEMCEETNC